MTIKFGELSFAAGRMTAPQAATDFFPHPGAGSFTESVFSLPYGQRAIVYEMSVAPGKGGRVYDSGSHNTKLK